MCLVWWTLATLNNISTYWIVLSSVEQSWSNQANITIATSQAQTQIFCQRNNFLLNIVQAVQAVCEAEVPRHCSVQESEPG